MMEYADVMSELIEQRAAVIERHLPEQSPPVCPGCGEGTQYATYADARRCWARHIAEDTYQAELAS